MPACDRRRFLKRFTRCGLALAVGEASGQTGPTLPAAVQTVQRALPVEYELIRQGCLAANSHNAQAWRFQAAPGRISVRADVTRRCPVVDPRDHHLWVSIGCAVENIVQAAPGLARIADVTVRGDDRPEVLIALSGTAERSTAPLARSIAARQSTRNVYDGRPVPASDLKQLVAIAAGAGVEATLITDPARRDRTEALILEANAAQVGSAAYRRELKHWLRFNEADARRHGDGLFSACSGNPTLPAWMGEMAFDWFYTVASANETLAEQLRSASGLILLHSARHDLRQWIEVGRSTQRLALQMTALGIKMAFVNQALEVESIRPRLHSALDLGDRYPDILLRFGYAPAMPASFRRPTDDVLV